MNRIITTDYFRCDGCGIECRVDSVPSDSLSQHTIQHCPAGKGINIVGRVIVFQQRHGSDWVSVEPLIDAA
jgi:hypothetical protein